MAFVLDLAILYAYIDIFKTSMSKQHQKVTLKIPTAKEKLINSFPNDPKGNMKLVFKSKAFSLNRAYLILQSAYFARVCTPSQTLLQIKQNFPEQQFERVLSCFYGGTIHMERKQLWVYYPIIKFLQIDTLLSKLREDVLASLEHYQLFVVMSLAHEYSDEQIFNACLDQLEKQSFQQLKYIKFEFIQIKMQLFKLIIKTHNQHRKDGKPGLPFYDIDNLIRSYCDGKGLGENAYTAMKFELIDKSLLTSVEYKQIFVDDYFSRVKNGGLNDLATGHSITVGGGTLNRFRLQPSSLSQSVISPTITYAPSLTANNFNSFAGKTMTYSTTANLNEGSSLEKQNIFIRKRNNELMAEIKKLEEIITDVRQKCETNQKIHTQCQEEVKNLKQSLAKKQQTIEQITKTVTKLQTLSTKLMKQLSKKSQQIQKLAQNYQQLRKRRPIDYQQQQNNMIAQSQFLPAHLISEMMQDNVQAEEQNRKRKKSQDNKNQAHKYEEMDEEQLEQLYLPRIKFDQQPKSTPKHNLPKLCNFITGQGFNRHTLMLIYRRSQTHPPRGSPADLRKRSNLLILLLTSTNQNIGGFVSVPIPSNQVDYIRDPGAFLFTLTKNQKFPIKQKQAQQAIFMSDLYLISFANDLMIAQQCLKEKSECSWPSSYQCAKGLKERGPVWFAGEGEFLVREIEVYEMAEEEMEMAL